MKGTTSESVNTGRRYDFDWLRVIGAAFVVIAHCAMIFSPWVAAQTNNAYFGALPTSKLLSEFVWNLSLWIMPLFMLLAGASAAYALRKRSNSRYLRERLVHLGLPLVLVTVLFVIPATYVAQSSAGRFSGSLLEFYPRFFDGIFPNGNFNLMHLWFLAYLLSYALLTLPLFRFLESRRGLLLIDWLARACSHYGGLFLLAVPIVAVQLALTGFSPPLETSVIVNDWGRFVGFLLVFIIGYLLVSDPRFQQAIARQWSLALVVTLVLSAVLFVVAWPDDFNPYRTLPIDYSWQYTAFWTVYALCGWSWLLVWLGAGQRFLNRNHRWLKPCAQASFPVYLLHLPVWIPSVFLIAQLHIGAMPAFLILTALVFTGTLALTALLNRWRFTAALLGFKPRTAHPAGQGLRRKSEEIPGPSPLLPSASLQ